MAKGDIDECLGNWMPTMDADIASYRKAGRVETAQVNLEGAKYALTTNSAAPHWVSRTLPMAQSIATPSTAQYAVWSQATMATA